MAKVRASIDGSSGTPFAFSADNLITTQSGNGKSYTFTESYNRCLVLAAWYLAGAQARDLTFTDCTVESKADNYFGQYSGYIANSTAYIITGVNAGSKISAPTNEGFIVYSMD